MAVKITQCPAGYAYGYSPTDESTQFHDLGEDTQDVGAVIDLGLSARSMGSSGKGFWKFKRLENRYAQSAFLENKRKKENPPCPTLKELLQL